MIATLPMYFWPALAPAHRDFWHAWRDAIRARGGRAPDELSTGVDHIMAVGARDLVVAQTCGYPFLTTQRSQVKLVATPCYDAAECDGANYCSLLVVQADNRAQAIVDLRGGVAAFNSRCSQSGYNALRAVVAPHAREGRFFAQAIETGGHENSMEYVAAGKADCAAIDAVTWVFVQRLRPELAMRLRVLGRSQSVPGLPYVTAKRASEADVEALRGALDDVMRDPALAGVRRDLLLGGAEVLPVEAYQPILEMEADAVRLGYRELA